MREPEQLAGHLVRVARVECESLVQVETLPTMASMRRVHTAATLG
jgi:hypothetical protein